MPVTAWTGLSAQSPEPWRCYASHYAAYANAQRQYQVTIERLASRSNPELRQIAFIARTEQVARINARERAVQFLLQADRARLRLDRPVNEWLDWGPAEARQLAQIDPVFARMEQLSAKARQQASGHPDWAMLQAAARDHLQRDPAHVSALKRIMALARTKPHCGGSGGRT